jgi:hypothetical protein
MISPGGLENKMLATEMVEAQLAEYARRPPSHDWCYGGPVSVLVLERGQPPRWLRCLAPPAAALRHRPKKAS